MSTKKAAVDKAAVARSRELQRHESTIEEAQKSFVELGRALGKIRAQDLYSVAGYSTFENYVEDRWDIGRQYAYRLINAARVALALSPMGYKITSERVARELAALPSDDDRVAVAEEASRRSGGKLTAALVAATREELFPDVPVIDSTFTEEAPSLTDAMRQAIEEAEAKASLPAEAYRCENCDHFLADPFVKRGERRCINCDADRIHVAAKPGGPCVECAIQASSIGSAAQQTAAEGNGFPPEADGDEGSFVGPKTSPAGSGDSSSLVAGSGLPQNSPAADVPLTSPHAGVPAVGDQNAVLPRTAPEDDGLDPVPSSSSGESSPTGSEGSRSETNSSAGPDQHDLGSDAPEVLAVATTVLPGIDHHRPGAGLGSGAAPEESRPSDAPVELEGGGSFPPASPSSSDPDVLVALFKAFTEELDRIDVEVIAPLLLEADVEHIEESCAQISTFVGLIDKWRRTP